MASSFKYDQRFHSLSEAQTQTIFHTIEIAFNPEILRTRVKSTIESLLRKEDIEQILLWLNSAVGRRITELEKIATFQDLKMDMVVFKQQQIKFPPTQQRINLMQRLYTATKVADSAVMMNMIIELTLKLISIDPVKKVGQAEIYQLMKQLMKKRGIVEKEIRVNILDNLMLTFHEATDSEIENYIEFANSSVGIAYHRALLDAYNSSLIDATLYFGETITSNQSNSHQQFN